MKRFLMMMILCVFVLSGCANTNDKIQFKLPDKMMSTTLLMLSKKNVEITENEKQLVIRNVTDESVNVLCVCTIFVPGSDKKTRTIKWMAKILPYNNITINITNDTTFFYHYFLNPCSIDGQSDGKLEGDVLFVGVCA